MHVKGPALCRALLEWQRANLRSYRPGYQGSASPGQLVLHIFQGHVSSSLIRLTPGPLQQVLLDVGAGNGYFSLAAAARGHRAIAFELSNASLASFEASVAYNGFGKLVTLHKVGGPWPWDRNLIQMLYCACSAQIACALDACSLDACVCHVLGRRSRCTDVYGRPGLVDAAPANPKGSTSQVILVIT